MLEDRARYGRNGKAFRGKGLGSVFLDYMGSQIQMSLARLLSLGFLYGGNPVLTHRVADRETDSLAMSYRNR